MHAPPFLLVNAGTSTYYCEERSDEAIRIFEIATGFALAMTKKNVNYLVPTGLVSLHPDML